MSKKIAMIVAMASNRVIGRDNQLPWHIPGDLKFFKATTLGKPVVMGRKTFESIGRPLPGRDNIVITRNGNWQVDGVRVVHDLAGALEMARDSAETSGAEEIMVIGGGEIFTEVLPRTDRLYLTLVQADVEGDAYFPELDWAAWHEISREDVAADNANPYASSGRGFERATG